MCSKLTNNTCTINTTQTINEAQRGDTHSLILDKNIDAVYVTSKIGLTMTLQEFSITSKYGTCTLKLFSVINNQDQFVANFAVLLLSL